MSCSCCSFLYEEQYSSSMDCSHKGSIMQSLDISLLCVWISCWTNGQWLKTLRNACDVTVIHEPFLLWHLMLRWGRQTVLCYIVLFVIQTPLALYWPTCLYWIIRIICGYAIRSVRHSLRSQRAGPWSLTSRVAILIAFCWKEYVLYWIYIMYYVTYSWMNKFIYMLWQNKTQHRGLSAILQ